MNILLTDPSVRDGRLLMEITNLSTSQFGFVIVIIFFVVTKMVDKGAEVNIFPATHDVHTKAQISKKKIAKMIFPRISSGSWNPTLLKRKSLAISRMEKLL